MTLHPPYYPLLLTRLLPCLLLSTFVLTLLFTFTYLPQAAFLFLFHGPGAWINATFLVLGEGAAIIALLFEAFLVDETMVDVFDAVMVEKGHADLVANSRPVAAATLLSAEEEDGQIPPQPTPQTGLPGPNPVKRLGRPTRKSVYAPFSLRQILEFIILLPLNLVPVAGVPLFLILTGWRGGPLQHWRYFELRGLGRKERNREVRGRRWRYTWFGTTALLLQLVPVLSMVFLITTAAGSALWAAKLEEERREEESREREGPQYVDDPV
ncbi:hypothetical protein K402DRAFT_396569 [Aulographum hederae CBS 113979]|uniref:Uncharacterized protein n=1 Tax=Aulographum hederae CBS 113979 TaxID=1176131 RepID=A0A6G1GRG4_9PEZI|nr:hypothetical protein K402DRAFT_396569 [Aulographum hederae CBS 113979]